MVNCDVSKPKEKGFVLRALNFGKVTRKLMENNGNYSSFVGAD